MQQSIGFVFLNQIIYSRGDIELSVVPGKPGINSNVNGID